MSKLIATIAIAFALAACGSEPDTDIAAPATTAVAATTAAPTTTEAPKPAPKPRITLTRSEVFRDWPAVDVSETAEFLNDHLDLEQLWIADPDSTPNGLTNLCLGLWNGLIDYHDAHVADLDLLSRMMDSQGHDGIAETDPLRDRFYAAAAYADRCSDGIHDMETADLWDAWADADGVVSAWLDTFSPTDPNAA